MLAFYHAFLELSGNLHAASGPSVVLYCMTTGIQNAT
jgi:hypothetical protein